MPVNPAISDDDIRRASTLLGLPNSAFFGAAGNDPRADVLKAGMSIDVAACPGSGKTTLLVAKLAILAEKWTLPTQGICVLSHTNAARREIETRLGHSTVGQRLLSYPHHIGTIHGFVDEFLALPWLRSKGFPIKVIDTERVCRRRWYRLRQATRAGLQRNGYDEHILTVRSPDFSPGPIRWGGGALGATTQTNVELQSVCRESSEHGYFCYDEMFVWAHELLDKVPQVVRILRTRFPIFFLDEAQDNGESQSRILHRIFVEGDGPVLRQRFGDENQAIYDRTGGSAAATDPFPIDAIKKDLPSSHRFGPGIAKLANPLGLVPHGLVGNGPKMSLASGQGEGRHTLFLFPRDKVQDALKKFGDLLANTFSADEVRSGSFIAVGQVHNEQAGDKMPHYTGHYWPEYNPGLSRMDPKPKTLAEYVHFGQAKAAAAGEVGLVVEKIGDGILWLARTLDADNKVGHPRHIHRFILEQLEHEAELKRLYLEFVDSFALQGLPLTQLLWEGTWASALTRVAERIGGQAIAHGGDEAQAFVRWTSDPSLGPLPVPVKSRDNVFRHLVGGREIPIRMGSIHSVKGETHTAALVLETHWYDYNLHKLVPWITGTRAGGGQEAARQKDRLKLHYVAMSRPTHLLCVAMRIESFHNQAGQVDQALIDKAKLQGWDVVTIN